MDYRLTYLQPKKDEKSSSLKQQLAGTRRIKERVMKYKNQTSTAIFRLNKHFRIVEDSKI